MDTGRADTRESAVTQLQQLVEGNLIHHVTFDHTFSDAKLFFRPSHGQEGPSIFSLAGDKKNALSWVRVSGVGFLGLGSNAAGVIGVDREHNAIHHFVNDIAPAPKSSIPITVSPGLLHLCCWWYWGVGRGEGGGGCCAHA